MITIDDSKELREGIAPPHLSGFENLTGVDTSQQSSNYFDLLASSIRRKSSSLEMDLPGLDMIFCQILSRSGESNGFFMSGEKSVLGFRILKNRN